MARGCASCCRLARKASLATKGAIDCSRFSNGNEVTEREKLKREIYMLGQIIQTNAAALATKSLNDEDRDSLKRQMTLRLTHQKLLQQRLDRLTHKRT